MSLAPLPEAGPLQSAGPPGRKTPGRSSGSHKASLSFTAASRREAPHSRSHLGPEPYPKLLHLGVEVGWQQGRRGGGGGPCSGLTRQQQQRGAGSGGALNPKNLRSERTAPKAPPSAVPSPAGTLSSGCGTDTCLGPRNRRGQDGAPVTGSWGCRPPSAS